MNQSILKTEMPKVIVSDNIKPQSNIHKAEIISGLKIVLLRIRMRLIVLRLILSNYSNPLDWIKALQHLINLRKNVLGTPKIKKLARINGNYYMGIYTAAWFSEDFNAFIKTRLNDYKPLKNKVKRFNMVFLAVTNKCPLQCEHCYDWNPDSIKTDLSSLELKRIVKTIQNKGVSHLQFLGGEPLLESKKICEVVKASDPGTDFWITTSGYSLDYNKALELKTAGIKGIIVSLDHFNPEHHNTFRNNNKAFKWVEMAVKNGQKAQLIVALSICVTKEFISNSNLTAYMELAKKLGVTYVQFLEPKAVGQYYNKDVLLSQKHIAVLENFFLNYNFKSTFKAFPIIVYPGYHQRREGCMFSGKKSIYVDTEGNLNACPFCHKTYGKILDKKFELQLELLVSSGCKDFS